MRIDPAKPADAADANHRVVRCARTPHKGPFVTHAAAHKPRTR